MANTSQALILYPELRLVSYSSDQKANSALSVGGNLIKVSDLKDQVIVRSALNDLLDQLISTLKVRMGGGGLALPDQHNNHPAIGIAKQLLHFCEQGKAGYQVTGSDDATDPNRKFMLLQVTRQ